ncbi:MAG: hypothetical protein HOC23_24820 [Halieaceae bacterium]|jgi:hypothetical protein|nr:hypothetical protein [Halieaceae bacterium]
MLLMTACMAPLGAAQEGETLPDISLLEYLAELVEVDGKLIGPLEMADDPELDQTGENQEQPGAAGAHSTNDTDDQGGEEHE